MARTPTAVFVAVLLAVALLPVRTFLTKEREVIAATPAGFTGLNAPIPIPEHGEACADEILFDTDAQIARFGIVAPEGDKGPALEVVARGVREGEYRSDYRSVARIAGGYAGTRTVDLPLRPPKRAVFGTFCLRNLGPGAVSLVGNEDGRAFARPTVRVNGNAVALDFPLRFLERKRSSYLSRAGQIMARASTLRPFGAWWWWLLTIGVGILAPLGIALAMRSALTADVAVRAREQSPLAAWPPEGVRRRLAAVPGWALVAVGCSLAVLWFLYWGVNTHVFQFDEDQYVYLSRWLQTAFPQSLWDFPTYGRGLQRLEVWLLAIPSVLFDSPWSLVGGRFLNTVAFVSTAIPVYRLGRALGLRAQWASLPALASAVVPWAVVTTAFLTENAAYPAAIWVVWAIWRTTAAPSARRDLLALALLIVAGSARSALLLLAPVLPATVLIAGLRCGAGSLRARLAVLPRQHVLLWIAVAAAALPLLLGPLGVNAADTITRRLAGGYPTHVDIGVWALLSKSASYFSRSVIGTGFLPAAVGLPWLVIGLARPRSRDHFAFAVVVVLSADALLYSLAPAGPDERYVVYLAPLLLLSATLAIARGEASPLGLGITSILLAALLLNVSWNPKQGPFGFFVAPAEMFYSRALGLRLSNYLPGDGGDALIFVAAGLGAGGVLLAVLLHRAPARLSGRPAAALVAAVLLAILVQTQYTMTKYVNGAGSKSAAGLKQRAFADRDVPHGASVGEFAEGVGLLPDFIPLWREVQFYNERIETVYTFAPFAIVSPAGDSQVLGVAHDTRTGRVKSPVPLTDYVVAPSELGTARLRGEAIDAPSYIPVVLWRIARPATLAWWATGFEPRGVVLAGGRGNLRFYGTGLDAGAYCATLTLAAAPDRAAAWRVERARRRVAGGTIATGMRRQVRVALPRLVERGFVDVGVRGNALQVLDATVSRSC